MTYQPKIYKKPGGNELVVASGGKINVETGGYTQHYVETISTSANTLTAAGVSVVTPTTVGPTFLIANPITGVFKYITLAAGSTAATNRAIISPASTGVSFGTSGQNVITLSTSTLKGVSLVGISTAAYRVVGAFHNADAALSNVST
jgi:hypothetical protein